MPAPTAAEGGKEQRRGRLGGAAAWLAERPATVVLGLALAAGVWAVVGSQQVFPYLSDDHDEGIYLLQADALAHGHLFPPAPKHPDAFTPWLSVLSEGRYIVKYTPVHASFLAAGFLLGSPRWSLGLIAAGVVGLAYGVANEVLRDRRLAALAAAFLALSPLFLLQTTTFLPYCSSLLLLLGFTFTLFRGMRTDRPALLVASGFVFGVALFARPYDALVFGAPLGLYFVVSQWRDRPRLLRNGGRFVMGAGLPVIAMLAYFRAATGSPFRSPFNLLEPQDTIGFGTRRLLPTHPDLTFTPSAGWYGLTRYILLTSFWGFGGLLLVGFFLVGAFRRRMTGPQPWLALVTVSVSCGYLFFWGAYATSFRGGLTALLGPFYFLPVLVPLCVLAAKGFRVLWRSDRALARITFASMLVVSGYLLVKAVNVNLRLTDQDRRLYASVSSLAGERALVFVPPMYGPHLLHPFAWLRNDAEYDGRVVWALDRGEPANLRLIRDYPGRSPYKFRVRGHYRANPSDPNLGSSLERLRVVRQPSLDATVRVRNTLGEPYVVLGVAVRGTKDSFILDTRALPGERHVVGLRVDAHSVELSGEVDAHVREPAPREDVIVISVEVGPDLASLRTVYERRVGYETEGESLRALLPGATVVDELGGTDPITWGPGPRQPPPREMVAANP